MCKGHFYLFCEYLLPVLSLISHVPERLCVHVLNIVTVPSLSALPGYDD